MTDLTPKFDLAREEMIAEYGASVGQQSAALGADRFARFMQGHASVQRTALFLVMSTLTVAHVDHSGGSLQGLRRDAAELRRAADQWATDCEELADMLEAQRQEHAVSEESDEARLLAVSEESDEAFERRQREEEAELRADGLHKGELE